MIHGFQIRENKSQQRIMIDVNNNRHCLFIKIRHRNNETLQ